MNPPSKIGPTELKECKSNDGDDATSLFVAIRHLKHEQMGHNPLGYSLGLGIPGTFILGNVMSDLGLRSYTMKIGPIAAA
jgi:hypothetical protein